MAGELTFGGLDWMGGVSAVDGWVMHALAEDADFGAPQPLVEALPRLLLDGEAVTWQRDSNRELSFRVEVRAADGVALAKAEAALAAEVHKPMNTLRWRLCSAPAAVSLFETYRGRMRLAFSDIDELVRHRRVYEITLPCAPYAASEDEIVVSATPVGGAAQDVEVDACGSATGWAVVSASGSASISASTARYVTSPSSLRVAVTASRDAFYRYWSRVLVRRTFGSALDLSTTRYLTVVTHGTATDYRTDYGGGPGGGSGEGEFNLPIRMWADGQELMQSGMAALSGGWTRWWFYSPDPSVTTVDIQLAFSGYSTDGTVPSTGFNIDDVRRTNTPPAGAGNQTFWMPVDGVMRTPGSIQLSGMPGTVEVLTVQNVRAGFTPWLDQWASVAYSSPGFTGRVLPATAVRPGQYALAGAEAGTYETVLVSGSSAPAVTSSVTTRGAPVLHLPPAGASDNSTYSVGIKVPGSVESVSLVPLEDASYTRFVATTDYAWIDIPSPQNPVGGLMVGNNADRSDAFSIVGTATRFGGAHQLTPPGTMIFVRGAGSVSLRYRPRWHTTAPR